MGILKWQSVSRYWCCAFANNQHQIELGQGRLGIDAKMTVRSGITNGYEMITLWSTYLQSNISYGIRMVIENPFLILSV